MNGKNGRKISMRLRHIPGAEQQIEESPHVIHEPKEKRGKWQQIFGNNHPIWIEVGMGKGKFVLEMAQKYPEINFVGIERYSTVLLKAIRKREQLELSNIYFMCEDARELAEMFAPGEVDRVFLNFSDPWPKDRHARRRLTSPPFMAVYDQILKKDGQVEFKTDNRELFDYSLEAIPEAGWILRESTFDLHHSDMAEGNVMTEYETKFAAEGKPICKLIAYR
jgi:tRNA (guanine-N7-)-methyltransferase